MNRLPVAAVAVALTLTLSACSDDTKKADDGPEPLTSAEQATVDSALAEYTEFVQGELEALVTETGTFVTAVKAGDDDEARTIYPKARMHWERVETIAAEFGDLDPAIDAREAGLDEGDEWTGWHRLEKDLWPQRAEDYTPLTAAERATLADKLLADTKTIQSQGADLELTVTDIVEGSQGLIEEVAGGKITGEEEYWSRTDLWDFQANIDGAKLGFELLEPVIEGRDQDLADDLAEEFTEVQALLDEWRAGDGFVTYDTLTDAQIKQGSDLINALGESLAEVSAIIGE